MSIIKRATLVAGATSAIALAIAISPADAGVPPTTGGQTATLHVTKVVEGAVPADAEFTIVANCEGSGTHELTFGAEGGEQQIVFFSEDQCDITEPDNGGARSTTGLGEINIVSPTDYSVTVVNSFDPAASSLSTTTEAATAADTTTRPRFTG